MVYMAWRAGDYSTILLAFFASAAFSSSDFLATNCLILSFCEFSEKSDENPLDELELVSTVSLVLSFGVLVSLISLFFLLLFLVSNL